MPAWIFLEDPSPISTSALRNIIIIDMRLAWLEIASRNLI
jgi:hypothetical protein